MASTITLKGIPDDVYQSLKASAQAHHRSLNSEILSCLERVLLPTRVSAGERLARARQLRVALTQEKFNADDIAEAIGQGRP